MTSEAKASGAGDPLLQDRARGAMLGLAVGDALGATLEFAPRDSRPCLTEMVGGGPFHLNPGEWTDDTAMALALADSLAKHRGLYARDLMTRFVAWYREGTYSCTGTCFDIGTTTRAALHRFERTGDPFAGATNSRTAGNGSLMRVAPVALYALQDARLADHLAREQSRTTHGALEAVDACAFFVHLLRSAIRGTTDILRPCCWSGAPAIRAIAEGRWRGKTRDEIRSSGYVIDTLEAAIWAVGSTTSFEEALILAVNLGGDADTVGAVTGQIAGAIYGAAAIPQRWLQPLAWGNRLAETADQLLVPAEFKPLLGSGLATGLDVRTSGTHKLLGQDLSH